MELKWLASVDWELGTNTFITRQNPHKRKRGESKDTICVSRVVTGFIKSS